MLDTKPVNFSPRTSFDAINRTTRKSTDTNYCQHHPLAGSANISMNQPSRASFIRTVGFQVSKLSARLLTRPLDKIDLRQYPIARHLRNERIFHEAMQKRNPHWLPRFACCFLPVCFGRDPASQAAKDKLQEIIPQIVPVNFWLTHDQASKPALNHTKHLLSVSRNI